MILLSLERGREHQTDFDLLFSLCHSRHVCVFLLLDKKQLAIKECRRLVISMANTRLPDSTIRSSLNNHVRNRMRHLAQKFKGTAKGENDLELLREVALPVAYVILQARPNYAVGKTFARHADPQPSAFLDSQVLLV